MKRSAKLMLPLIAGLFLTACAGSTVSNDYCLIAEPIPNSTRNAEFSRVAIDKHNNVGVSVCGWRP